jgi:hypothetical protein
MDRNAGATWILLVAVLTYSVLFVGYGIASYRANDGHIVYALDDAYIHMAIAKNVVQQGTFGITPYEFDSASSSPLWTAVLAALYAVLGVSEALPLLLNFAFGVVALLLIDRFGTEAGLGGLRLALLLGASILLTPMVPLAFTGMEHLLHLCSVVLLVHALWRLLAQQHPVGLRQSWFFGIAAALAMASRYESAFLIAVACVVLGARRRWIAVAVGGVGALTPVCVVGIFGLTHGGDFLPSSLLLKGNVPQLDSLAGIVGFLGLDALRKLFVARYLLTLGLALVSCFVWLRVTRRGSDAARWLLLVVAAASVLHLQFAETGWFYRYDAYLVALAVIVLSLQELGLGRESRRRLFGKHALSGTVALALVALLLLYPPLRRAAAAHYRTVQATTNIYQQQYQLGRFLQAHYHGQSVAANDVGAINFLAQLQCLDLWGLASSDVRQHLRDGTYSTAVMRELAAKRRVRIAVVYTSWFLEDWALPEEWIVVGRWTIPNNIVCGSDTVSFLATRPQEILALTTHLKNFAKELPEGVVWERVPIGRRAPSVGADQGD